MSPQPRYPRHACHPASQPLPPAPRSPSLALLAGSIVLALATLSACGRGNDANAGPGGAFGGPAAVAVITATPETLPLTLEYPARLAGEREVEVRARVTGVLQQHLFSEGGNVKSGQALFRIDPAPFELALARSSAELAAADARLAQARRELARLTPLLSSQAVSQKEVDDATSQAAILAAEAEAAKVRQAEARLNLEWTEVRAPASGTAGRSLRSQGTLISGPEVLLTTLTQTDPIQARFGLPDNDRLRLEREAASGELLLPAKGRYTATLLLADGSTYAQSGKTDFSDLLISPDTGASEMRARFANPAGLLHPGQLVRIRLEGAQRRNAFRVPQRAVLEGPQGRFVYVVGAENKAEVRPVSVSSWDAGHSVISSGLKAGDQVIVDGVIKLGPGAPVAATPLETRPGSDAGAAASPAREQ